MSLNPHACVVCSDLGFAWPDGTRVFDGLDLVLGPVRAGLVGRNGTGKSTLLRLVAGELRPTRGSVTHDGVLGHLPQDLGLAASVGVDETLGIHRIRRALDELERGRHVDANLAVVGHDWDAEERARTLLGRLGLGHVGLDRRIGELSGGETVLLGLAAELVRRPDVLLLDEPTNNLDRRARQHLYDTIDAFDGTLLVVSHDRELLERMDQIRDLRDGAVATYGGAFSDYERALAEEQEAAAQAVRTAGSDLRRQKRELADARIKLDRRLRYGQKMWDTKREPKVVMGERKRQAQVAAGKHLDLHQDRLATARGVLEAAEARVHDDADIRIDLADTRLPNRRVALHMDGVRLRTGQDCDLQVRGPERIALTGANGVGKSTLLHTVAGDLSAEGDLRVPVAVRLLPQRLDILDDSLTVAENVARFAPLADHNTVRARLARFLFRGSAADQHASTLSGGERFRASLAALLLADPAPQLLLLDEPTHNLDLPSVSHLVSALEHYGGALVVASHDMAFLRDLGITRWIEVTREGLLETGSPPVP